MCLSLDKYRISAEIMPFDKQFQKQCVRPREGLLQEFDSAV